MSEPTTEDREKAEKIEQVVERDLERWVTTRPLISGGIDEVNIRIKHMVSLYAEHNAFAFAEQREQDARVAELHEAGKACCHVNFEIATAIRAQHE